MLQAMRNSSQGLAAKVIVFLIIVVFALWGVESIVSLGGGESPVVDVDGIEIYDAEVKRAVEIQKSNFKQQFGEAFNDELFSEKLLRDTALEQLINQKVSQKFAENLGLVASEAVIDRTILSIPAFQKDGKFDADQFRYFLAAQNMTPMGLRQRLSEDIKVAQLNQLIAIGDFVTPAQTKRWSGLLNEQRQIKYKLINTDDFIDKITLNDEQISEYYKTNEKRFLSEAQAKIQFLQISLDGLISEQVISTEDLAGAYADYKTQIEKNAQRASHHILIEITPELNAEAALNKANELYSKIQQGASFEELAKEHSDDLGSKQNSGNLGFAEAGSYEPEFESALSKLRVGEVSKPVKTEFGYHIIRLDEVKTGEVKSYESQEQRLLGELKRQKAEVAYSEKIQELTNSSFSAGNLEEVADSLGLKIQESDFFSRPAGTGIAANAKVRAEAFAENVLLDRELSPVIELDESVVVLTVSDYKEAALKPLAEVKSEIKQQLSLQMAQDMASKQTEALLDSSNTNAWRETTLVYKSPAEVDEKIKLKAFQVKQNKMTSVATGAGFAVFKVLEIKELEAPQDEIQQLEAAIAQERLRELLISMQSWAKSNMSIKRYGGS